jgi:hypothetical protein
MQIRISKLALAIAGAALLAGAYSLPAAATEQHHDVHHRMVHRTHQPVHNNDIIVRRHVRPEPVAVAPAPDAFHNGPATIITAPVAIAGTIVSLPFRLVEAVFPPNPSDPRVVVGGPVHVAGQVAGLPFFVVNSAFGVRSVY